MTVDILLVDDHPLLQIGLCAALENQGLSAVNGDANDRDLLLGQIEELQPDVVVLDHGLPALGDGLGLIGPVRDRGSRVLVLTGTEDRALWGALLEAGAEAVVSKSESLEAITDAIAAAVDGKSIRSGARSELLADLHSGRMHAEAEQAVFAALTRRESFVLGKLMEGIAPAAIAEAEYVSIDTVRSQIKSILRKLEVSSQLEAVAAAHRVRWTPSV